MGQTHSWASGVAGQCSAFTCGWLPGRLLSNPSQDNTTLGLCRFCMSELYFTVKKKNVYFNESIWGSHYLQPFRNLALGECLVVNDTLPFLLREKLEIHLEIHLWGCQAAWSELRRGKRGPTDGAFLGSGCLRLLPK